MSFISCLNSVAGMLYSSLMNYISCKYLIKAWFSAAVSIRDLGLICCFIEFIFSSNESTDNTGDSTPLIWIGFFPFFCVAAAAFAFLVIDSNGSICFNLVFLSWLLSYSCCWKNFMFNECISLFRFIFLRGLAFVWAGAGMFRCGN